MLIRFITLNVIRCISIVASLLLVAATVVAMVHSAQGGETTLICSAGAGAGTGTGTTGSQRATRVKRHWRPSLQDTDGPSGDPLRSLATRKNKWVVRERDPVVRGNPVAAASSTTAIAPSTSSAFSFPPPVYGTGSATALTASATASGTASATAANASAVGSCHGPSLVTTTMTQIVRFFILLLGLVLACAETPLAAVERLFRAYAPVLGPRFGLAPLGLAQLFAGCLAFVLGQQGDVLTWVVASLVALVGLVNILLGFVGKAKAWRALPWQQRGRGRGRDRDRDWKISSPSQVESQAEVEVEAEARVQAQAQAPLASQSSPFAPERMANAMPPGAYEMDGLPRPRPIYRALGRAF